MLIVQQESIYDASLANETRFLEINSGNRKPSKTYVTEYIFFDRFAGVCYVLAGGFGMALQVILIFWFIARLFG
jgi:hypothetical protein